MHTFVNRLAVGLFLMQDTALRRSARLMYPDEAGQGSVIPVGS